MSPTSQSRWPRRLWGGLGAVLTALVLAACVHPSLWGILQLTWLAEDSEPRQIQRDFQQAAEEIWYTGDALQMTFTGAEREGLQLLEHVHREPREPLTAVTQLDGATAVTTRCGQSCGTLADQELLLPRGSHLSIASDEGMYYSVQRLAGDLDLWLAGGDLTDVTVDGEPDAVLGQVTLLGVQGDVDVRTLRADVCGSSLSGDELSVRAGEGTVDLTHTALPTSLQVRTGHGDISIVLPAQDDPERCTVETDAPGEVEVDLADGRTSQDELTSEDEPVSPECRISLRTGDGDITVTSAPPMPWERD